MAKSDTPLQKSDQCNTTHWSIVLRAGNPHDSGAKEALSILCERYWFSLYSYVRRRGSDVAEAQDLTQEFFSYLLETNFIEQAEPERGRFRSFLLSSFKNFLSNERDRAQAVKRGGALRRLALDFDSGNSRILLEPSHALTPELLYERQWTLTLLDTTFSRLREEFKVANKLDQFELLKQTLSAGGEQIGYAKIAEQIGMSEEAARKSAHRLRRRYRELLREEVAQTIDSKADIDDEIKRLFESLEP